VTRTTGAPTQHGATALISSAQNGHVEVARLLLLSKADIHAADWVSRISALRSPHVLLPVPTWHAFAYAGRALAGMVLGQVVIIIFFLFPLFRLEALKFTSY
jgi:hypothetical protein